MSDKEKTNSELAQQYLGFARETSRADEALVSATIAVAYSNLATLDYIMERDSKPYDDARMMLDLGMELGLKRAKQEQENKNG